ncbi:MAG: hypothetical protein C5B60_04700 [Chloroflexi bacterium]|nr:MAG: hypothetical protein C5B60_04700 [Chloroflexota bacterium]
MADLTLEALREELAPVKNDLVDIKRAVRLLQQDVRELRTFIVGLNNEMARLIDRVIALEERDN